GRRWEKSRGQGGVGSGKWEVGCRMWDLGVRPWEVGTGWPESEGRRGASLRVGTNNIRETCHFTDDSLLTGMIGRIILDLDGSPRPCSTALISAFSTCSRATPVSPTRTSPGSWTWPPPPSWTASGS